MMDNDQLIARIPKNSREEFRISLTAFKGYDLASLRVWFQADDGSMRPSKSGVVIRVGKLPDLIEALQGAETEARRRGLISEGSPHG